MNAATAGIGLCLKDILFLTDLSEPSEAAMPFAIAIAREYGATIHALHVQTPEYYAYATPESAAVALEVEDELARKAKHILDLRLGSVPHDVAVVRDTRVWPAVEEAIGNCEADLIVLGTHGRTGPRKLLLGSVAEEILRRAEVPVLTVGPCVNGEITPRAQFGSILFPTDFTASSLAAAPFAVLLAAKNHSRLIVYHALHEAKEATSAGEMELRVTRAMRDLNCVALRGTEGCERKAIVGSGEPAEQILQVAKEQRADLIVLGVRDVGGHTGLTTRLSRAIASKVIAGACCPVLTVRA